MSYNSPGEGRTYLKNRWWEMLSISDERLQDQAADVFDVLCHYYSAPDRVYHTLEHIWYLLKAQEHYFPDMSRAGILAIFWHDVIYFPGSPNSEEYSAHMMRTYMKGLIGGTVIDFAALIVRETKAHDPHPVDITARQVCDLDLMGLGGPALAYDRNTDKIRLEFFRATDEQWVAGRRAFLSDRLTRPATFHTEVMSARFEDLARANMQRELDNLPHT